MAGRISNATCPKCGEQLAHNLCTFRLIDGDTRQVHERCAEPTTAEERKEMLRQMRRLARALEGDE